MAMSSKGTEGASRGRCHSCRYPNRGTRHGMSLSVERAFLCRQLLKRGAGLARPYHPCTWFYLL